MYQHRGRLLPPFQRRLRHLEGIYMRNLQLESMMCSIYFTIQAENEEGPIVYKSEVVRNTLNPSWKNFNYQQDFIKEIPPKCSDILIRVYTSMQENSPVYEKKVNLIDVTFISSHLSFLLSGPPNLLILKLTDGYYTCEDVTISPYVPDPVDYEAKPLSLQQAQKMLNRASSFSVTCKSLEADAASMQERIMQALARRNRAREQKRLLEIQQHRVMKLRSEYEWMKENVTKGREHIQQVRERIQQRTNALYDSCCQLMTKKHLLKQERETLLEERLHLDRIKFSLSKRRTYLVSQLRSILPIAKSTDGKTYKILTLRIPNGEFLGSDEEIEAAALGYVCLLVTTLSKYLDVPLRYPMKFMGSRSLIYDFITIQSSSEFQLYLKGAESQRYEYAVHLLSRNVEQLLNTQSINVSKLRSILPNIQMLLANDNIGGSDFDRIIHRWPGMISAPPSQTTPPSGGMSSPTAIQTSGNLALMKNAFGLSRTPESSATSTPTGPAPW
eukprot:TRINITY_DN6431_c0_g1_i2.p1 TRINITY_DN6431_c0_g1~~TRINITY_DN6431_c0_g1_i2.p1  ORF type:complete len:500 (+),score=74.26 TRINITY_DN6431_c0_g1_i2:50-1549(+)